MRAIISGREFDLERRDVERQARLLEPEPIQRHFVEIGDARYTVKQIVAAVTGLDRNAFTSQQARAVLLRLGLRVGALDATGTAAEAVVPYRAQAAPWWVRNPDALAPHQGKWVALGDTAVLVAADSPTEVVAWLSARKVCALAMFRVSRGEMDLPGGDVPAVWS